MDEQQNHLAVAAQEAVEAAGGSAVIARELGISLAAITHWKRRGVPADRALTVERLSGVSRHKLRPDVFGARVALGPEVSK